MKLSFLKSGQISLTSISRLGRVQVHIGGSSSLEIVHGADGHGASRVGSLRNIHRGATSREADGLKGSSALEGLSEHGHGNGAESSVE